MKLSITRGGVFPLLLAVASFFIFPTHADAREPLARRLLRTIQIGVPQDLTVSEIRKIAESDDTDYTTAILARSALVVLRQDDAKLIPYAELLDNLLNRLVSDGSPYQPLAALPSFRGKETAFTMVYALVMSGNESKAVDILEKHALTGSKYKQAVVLSALRNIGTPRALSIIQTYAEKGQDRNLGETTMADEDYPVLSEIYDRWNLVPPSQRTQDNLRSIVQSGCDQRSVVAAYWLGFFAPNPDPNKETAELQALEQIVRTDTPTCEMMEHVIALKALGLRSAKSVDYWRRLAQHTGNVWEQHQIVINGFARWGRAFAPAALDLLKTDALQYVQWELLDGNLYTRQGRPYRTYWDIWIPANILLVQETDEAQWRPAMDLKELGTMLDWLDTGARPHDPVVLNHMIYHLAEFTSEDDTRRLLRVFNGLPQRNENWWILQLLRDPSALPLLNYWSTLPAPDDQKQMLDHTIGNLVKLANRPAPNSPLARACCDATEECLVQQLRHNTTVSQQMNVEIHSEEKARKWLRKGAATVGDFEIHYVDELKRSAIVQRSDGKEEHWEYLYDCWRNTGQPSVGANIH